MWPDYRPEGTRANIFRRIAGWFHNAPEFHYAHICSSGICYAVVRLDFQLKRPNAIAVDGLDASILGKRWTGNQWTGRKFRRGPYAEIPSGHCLHSDLFYITGGNTDGEAITKQGETSPETHKRPRSLQANM